MRTKAHRLTFRLELLEPVLSSSKCCTVRFSKVAARVQCGDALMLAFGAYHRPTVLQATAARVERFDLTAQLEQARETDAELDNLTAQEVREMDEAEEVLSGWTAADHRAWWLSEGVPAALLDALENAGGDFSGVLDEAEGRNATSCTAVWFSDVQVAG